MGFAHDSLATIPCPRRIAQEAPDNAGEPADGAQDPTDSAQGPADGAREFADSARVDLAGARLAQCISAVGLAGARLAYTESSNRIPSPWDALKPRRRPWPSRRGAMLNQC